MATIADPQVAMKAPGSTDGEHYLKTSGATDPVWVHKMPYSEYPKFPKLKENIEADVCIIGSGIAGISSAYELVLRGVNTVMIEARDILSGESGRTSGHLSNALDDGYVEIAKKHGDKGAKIAAESHTWALNRVGEIAQKLGIECEYRKLPGYEISQYPRGQKEHDEEISEIKEEVKYASSLGLDVSYKEGFAVRGWDGAVDQRDAAIFEGQATFHPTKYLLGVMKWLKEQPNFRCYTHTRLIDIQERGVELLGMGSKDVQIKTQEGHTITCKDAHEATCVPLQKLSLIAEQEYTRTYCIAIRVPKGSIEDCLLYDEADKYKYVRFTECDEKDDYLVIGGCDHKVGIEAPEGRFKELEVWVRERFTHAGSVDYAWSGQIFEPMDYMAFIGLNSGNKHIYVTTGDSGNGLTHYVLGARIIANLITGNHDPWAELYDPKRVTSLLKRATDTLKHDVAINLQYKRWLQSDIKDIEDLLPGTGGVLNPTLEKPKAVYKDENGKVMVMSAVCPHLHGIVCWNPAEKSWDCPVHGSRFSPEGMQIIGPSKAGLHPEDEACKRAQEKLMAA